VTCSPKTGPAEMSFRAYVTRPKKLYQMILENPGVKALPTA